MTVPNKSVIAVSGWNKQNIYLSIYLLLNYPHVYIDRKKLDKCIKHKFEN